MTRLVSPLLAALATAILLINTHYVVEAKFGRSAVLSAPQRWTGRKLGAFGLVQDVSRGGATTATNDDKEEEKGEAVELYLPGMLEASISKAKKVSDSFVRLYRCSSYLRRSAQTCFQHKNTIQATVSADSTITMSPSKAKELKFKEGTVIMVIGRRRRAAYGRVHISSKGTKKQTCIVSANMATNLRLRNGDKVKIASLSIEGSEDASEHSIGDMILFQSSPKTVTSVTFSPVEDSLASLESSEGGDEITDDEIMERFVTPYTELEGDSVGLVKKGHIVKMTDDNGKSLEFVVTHVELEGMSHEEDALEEEGTDDWQCDLCLCITSESII